MKTIYVANSASQIKEIACLRAQPTFGLWLNCAPQLHVAYI